VQAAHPAGQQATRLSARPAGGDPQAGGTPWRGGAIRLTVEIHEEDGVLWGQVVELPGCFATGDDLDELAEALGEAIVLYQSKESASAKQSTAARRQRYRVGRMTLVDA